MDRVSKKILLYVIFTLITVACNESSSVDERNNEITSLEDAIELTKDKWDKYRLVYALKEVVEPNTTFLLDNYTKETITTPKKECWVIFIHHIDVNSMLQYTWLIVNRKTGKILEVAANLPPLKNVDQLVEETKEWIKVKDTWTSNPMFGNYSPSDIEFQQNASPSF